MPDSKQPEPGPWLMADPFPPPKKAATPIPSPVGYMMAAPDPSAAKVAPWPAIDRFPTVLGSNLSLQTISSVMRQATTGYRQPWVDVLDELVERDTHAHAVIAQRAMAVAGGRVDITPCKAARDSEQPIADAIADFCATQWDSLPDRVQTLFGLQFQAIYTGIAALENAWQLDAAGVWRLTRCHFIHTRRLSFPDPGSWEVRIWDQGGVGGAYPGSYVGSPTIPTVDQKKFPTSATWGAKASDYPGKFVIHSPMVRGEYPTREGLGRVTSWWTALKLMAARGAGAYVERFAKPWAWANFTTTDGPNPRAANDDDIAKAQAAVVALGTGSATGATLPDTIKLNIQHPDGGKSTSGISFEGFIALCNAEISKAVLGQTFTVESGKYGSRATADVGKEGVNELYKYDAASLAETIRRDIVSWMVRLNFPQFAHLVPNVTVQLGDKPDPMAVMLVAKEAAAIGLPIDGKALAERIGMPLIDPTDPSPVRVATISPVSLSVLDDAIAAKSQALAPNVDPDSDDDTDTDDDGDQPGQPN